MSNRMAGVCIVLLGAIFLVAAVVILIWDSGRERKFGGTVYGVVVGHKWIQKSEMGFPVAIVEYVVDGNRYTVRQTYRAMIYNSAKHASENWEIDSKYRLCRYSNRKCGRIVDPTVDWFPVHSQMEVHYVPGNPGKAYCGALGSAALICKILLPVGAFVIVFGFLLITVLR